MGPRLLQGPISWVCSTTPRFSYGLSKVRVRAVSGSVLVRVRVRVRVRVWVLGGYRDGYTGWVIGGLYRVLPTDHALLEESALPSEAGPEGPAGAWSGGEVCSDVPSAVRSQVPPSGPGRSTLWPSLYLGPRNAASWP